jgi:hypothetical protein
VWAISKEVPADPKPSQDIKRAKLYQQKYAYVFTASEGTGKQAKCCICNTVIACSDAGKFLQHMKCTHADKLWWQELKGMSKLIADQTLLWTDAEEKRKDAVKFVVHKPSLKRGPGD